MATANVPPVHARFVDDTTRRGPWKRTITALVAALAITGSSAATAVAAPTGSITVGSRISTGQLIATFFSSSDLVDAEFGFGQSWFPEASVAAPGEPCVAGSSNIAYVGNVYGGPGWQRATRAVDADAGTLCLWVDAQQIHLVASTPVPPKHAPTAPAPAVSAPVPSATTPPRSAAVFLGSDRVLTVLRQELHRMYGSRFTDGVRYRRTCTRMSRRSFLCSVSWTWRHSRYSGTVRLRRDSVTRYAYVRDIRRSNYTRGGDLR